MSGSASPPHSLVSGEVTAALVKRALATPPGAFCEVGVYHGGTAWHLSRAAESQSRRIFLFDTFEGIPYKGQFDSHQVGDFRDTSLAEVQAAIPYAICIKGIFPESTRQLDPHALIRVAFVHLDCDQYKSYAGALTWFAHRMVPGGVIWCDDMPALEGAARAINEFCANTGRSVSMAEKAFIQF